MKLKIGDYVKYTNDGESYQIVGNKENPLTLKVDPYNREEIKLEEGKDFIIMLVVQNKDGSNSLRGVYHVLTKDIEKI